MLAATLAATWPHVPPDELHAWWMSYAAPAGATLGDVLHAADAVWPLTPAQVDAALAAGNPKCMAAFLEPAARERAFDAGANIQERPDGAYECAACLGTFGADDIVLCPRDHAQCRACFIQYVTVTHENEPLDSLPCPAGRDCGVPAWDPVVAALYLPPTYLAKLEARERETTEALLLSANVAARLFCVCGAVGIVEEGAVGDGTVACICGLVYCLRCGNIAHAAEQCGVPRDTLQWVNQNAKRCPNCGTAIEKNGGCNHVTCTRSAGGCGYEMCWLCLGKYRACKCPLFGNGPAAQQP